MILKPKKQLFDPQVLLLTLLAIPLIAFFVYATHFQASFFVVLIVALSFSIISLLFFRQHVIRRRSEFDLQKEEYAERVNLLEAEMDKEWQTIEAFQRKITNFSRLKGLTEKLLTCFTVDETSRALTSEINDLFGHRETTVIIYLFHSRTGELGLSASQKGQMTINIKDKKGDLFDQWVVRTMKPLLIEDAKSDFRFDADKVKPEDDRTICSVMSVPMVIGNRAIGILRVDSPLRGHFSGEDVRLLTTISDLAAIAIENSQLHERVEDLAIHDSLTGLYLRRYLLMILEQEISRTRRKNKELSFVMVDLDRFKEYNDKFGHTAGDILLRTVSEELRSSFDGPGTLVCRYGGEEFAVLLPECPKKKAMALAEQFRKAVETKTVMLRRKQTRTTVSAGVAALPDDAQDKVELIDRADKALYQAKEKGRNRVCGA